MNFKYNLNTYVQPFDEGEVIYYETILPLQGEDIQTLFPIEEVIAVTNYGLDIIYEEGKDYLIIDKKLVIIPTGRIKLTPLDEYYIKDKGESPFVLNKEVCKFKFDDDRFLKYAEVDYFTKKQIAITYKHKVDHCLFKQDNQKSQLLRFFKKLENKENPTILFYGDSITVGCNSSGTEYGGNTKPYAKSWPEMVTDYLKQQYNADINYVNTAVGGTLTIWGVENVEERVNKYHPDLLVLAFGMNDGPLSKEDHTKQIKEIIDKVRESNPECDIVLISTTVPNFESKPHCFALLGYQEEYRKLDYSHLCFVNMTEAHLSLLKRKAFKDMTGNNINHPNDFLARAYAQNILKAMGML